MSGLTMIVSAAFTTSTMLGREGMHIASNPHAMALSVAIMGLAVAMSLYAAWSMTVSTRRHVPPGPALPGLKRRFSGPGQRRH